MRPVARIAQSVEQGIENPRVLGSIPSPGTTYSENPAYGWVFAFLRPDSPSNYVRLFAAQRLTPSGPARQARCSTPAALVRVRAPLIQRTQPMAGFLLFYDRTLHRTAFDYSPLGSLHLQDIGWKLAYQKLDPKHHAKSGQNDDTGDIQKQAGAHHLLLLDMASGENDSVWRRRHGQHKSA